MGTYENGGNAGFQSVSQHVLYWLSGGQRGYRDCVVNPFHDVNCCFQCLPWLTADNYVLVVR